MSQVASTLAHVATSIATGVSASIGQLASGIASTVGLAPSPRTTVISAPGKVLLAGGYLVLDRLYTGLVVATSSRFYCCVSDVPRSTAADTDSNVATLTVRAGQFPSESSTWSYRVALSGSGTTISVSQVDEGTSGSNKFVQGALAKSVELAWALCAREKGEKEAAQVLLERLRGVGGGLHLTVLGDNDFYSQREQVCSLMYHC
jgi:phosphomevalonate kinase